MQAQARSADIVGAAWRKASLLAKNEFAHDFHRVLAHQAQLRKNLRRRRRCPFCSSASGRGGVRKKAGVSGDLFVQFSTPPECFGKKSIPQERRFVNMRGKISRGKQPRFAPVFRLFSAPAPSARKKYAALRFSLRLPLRRPRLRLCGAGPARKKEEPPPLFSLLYILSTDTHPRKISPLGQ